MEGTDSRLFLRFWDAELLLQMMEHGISHVQALVDPNLSVVARIDSDAFKITTDEPARERPGSLSHSEQQQIGLMLTARRRSLLATKIADTFPDHVSHLSPMAIEREVHDAWSVANGFGLVNGRTRAKFIITTVALAPGLHRERKIEKLFSRSKDPDQTFHDLEAVIKRRIGSINPEEVS